MSYYETKTLNTLGDLPKLTSETLDVMERLDKGVSSVASSLDKSLGKLKGKKTLSKKRLRDVQTMRQAVEIMSEKKAQVAVRSYDLIDHNIRMVDAEIRLLEKVMMINGDPRLETLLSSGVSAAKAMSQSTTSKKKRRVEEDTDVLEVDPNEPVYCLCRQIAFGEMIACDNEECSIEWFHYACVNLTKKPRSVWLCPDCAHLKHTLKGTVSNDK